MTFYERMRVLPGNIPGKKVKLRRLADDGTVKEFEILLRDRGLEHGMTFLVDADVEDGDEITETLPNGKTRTVRLHDVEVKRSPMGSGRLDRTLAKYTVVSAKAVVRQPPTLNLPGLHPLISASSGSQVATHHYDDAVFNAFKAIEDRVKTLSGSALSGKPLMANVFNEQSPSLDVTSTASTAVQQGDEREGFKFLFMGAAQALRNTRGHGPTLNTSEQEAMEMLATASLLMRALDRAAARTGGGQQ